MFSTQRGQSSGHGCRHRGKCRGYHEQAEWEVWEQLNSSLDQDCQKALRSQSYGDVLAGIHQIMGEGPSTWHKLEMMKMLMKTIQLKAGTLKPMVKHRDLTAAMP